MTILLCDIGGTHIRFAICPDTSSMSVPEKFLVERYTSLEDAVARYLSAQSIVPESVSAFYLAYSSTNAWNRDEAHLRSVLPKASIVKCNDFEANALGIALAPVEDFTLLRAGSGDRPDGSSRVVLGVGTGLGLAYIIDTPAGPVVQKTHGGHMIAASANETQAAVQRALMRPDYPMPIYEDVLSGDGLFGLYRHLCHGSHLNPQYHDCADLLVSGRDDTVTRQALQVFHEVLGVFAHQAVAFGGAYGGIYLTGGIVDRLIHAGLFDASAMVVAFQRPAVEVVARDAKATPIYWVRDEFISLSGLLGLARRAQG